MLSFDTQLASEFGITGNFDIEKGLLIFSGYATGSDWEKVLRTVSLTAVDTGIRSVTFNKGSLLGVEIDGCMHYYEYLPIKTTWKEAKSEAESKSYQGRQGYLATITSELESNFINTKVEGKGWIGASDEETEGLWRWVTGPEAGVPFWSGVANGEPTDGMFNNWKSNAEPNDYQTCSACIEEGGEDFALAGWDNNTWNDYPNAHQSIQGYVVEYGCMAGEDAEVISANYTITISGQTDLVIPDRQFTYTKAVEYAEMRGLRLFTLDELKAIAFDDSLVELLLNGEYWTSTAGTGDRIQWMRVDGAGNTHIEDGEKDFYKNVAFKIDAVGKAHKSYVDKEIQASWYQAGYICNEIGMRMPTVDELKTIYFTSNLPEGRDQIGLPKAEYWTSDIKDADEAGTAVMMRLVGPNEDYKLEESMQKQNYKRVICVEPDEGEDISAPTVSNVRGVLYGDDGIRVADATVEFRAVSSLTGAVDSGISVTTDSNGEYSLDLIAYGKYVVIYKKEGYTSKAITIYITTNNQVLGDIGITEKALYIGNVANAGAGASVKVVYSDGYEETFYTDNYSNAELWIYRDKTIDYIQGYYKDGGATGSITEFSLEGSKYYVENLLVQTELPDNYDVLDSGCGGEANEKGWCDVVAVDYSSQYNSETGIWTYSAVKQERSDVSVDYFILGLDSRTMDSVVVESGETGTHDIIRGIQVIGEELQIKTTCENFYHSKAIQVPIYFKVSNGDVYSKDISAPICVQSDTNISGQVTFQGTPIAGATVYASLKDSPKGRDYLTTTDSNGNYSLLVHQGEDAVLGVEPAHNTNFAETTGVLLKEVLSGESSVTKDIELVGQVDLIRYVMRPIENGQVALPNAKVEFKQGDTVVYSTTSSSTGQVTARLSFGTYTIVYTIEGYETFTETITIESFDSFEQGVHTELVKEVSTTS
jgi:hypothetical protein